MKLPKQKGKHSSGIQTSQPSEKGNIMHENCDISYINPIQMYRCDRY